MAIYVMSDLHGLKDRFDTMLEKIHFSKDDMLYILGDVIDRGNDGIALLQQIKNHKNMQLLMGNHEHMMIEYIHAKEQFKKGKDILESMMIMRRWDMNHNQPTKDAFESLTKREQKALLNYIENLPLAFPNVMVNKQCYYLVHASPHPFSYKEDIITMKWCHEKKIDPYTFIWERSDGEFDLPKQTTLIFGHTITGYYHLKYPYEIWYQGTSIQTATIIDIDCGCAANNQDTRLCCLRLDDREVFYE